MYCHVRNLFKIPNEEGKIEEFIKIENLDEFNLYELFMKLQLFQNENFYQINTCFNLNDVMSGNIDQLNSDIIALISQYTYLGEIDFKITNNKMGVIEVLVNINLNNPIKGLSTINHTFSIGDKNVK